MNVQDDKKPVSRGRPMLITCIVMCLMVLLISGALYLTLFRYSLVGRSLNLSNNWGTAMLLSPEIALSISTLM